MKRTADIGYRGITLVGQSDLDFILEWACHRYGMDFVRDKPGEGFFTVYSERESREMVKDSHEGELDRNLFAYLVNSGGENL